jgi:NADH dehydrogenase FAD-containing subunit
MNYLIDTFFNKKLHKQHNEKNKENIVLLGDGFFARGFLHNIDRSKFKITQIYKNSFINPQDLIFSLQKNKKYNDSYHLKDILYPKGDVIIKGNITKLSIEDKKVFINNRNYDYDHLVIGLGANKSIKEWSDNINSYVDKKDQTIGIVGMGPTGIELAIILSKYNTIHLYDSLPKDNVLSYINKENKEYILDLLEKKDIKTNYERLYDGKSDGKYDTVIFCVGTRPNSLTNNYTINNKLEVVDKRNVYMGGDCANTTFLKNGQSAYQQGAYVAKKLNGEISIDEVFTYKSNGISLNVGDNKVIIEGHNILPDSKYPDFIIKMYSLFCI